MEISGTPRFESPEGAEFGKRDPERFIYAELKKATLSKESNEVPSETCFIQSSTPIQWEELNRFGTTNSLLIILFVQIRSDLLPTF